MLPEFFDARTLDPLNSAIAQLVARTQPWSADVAARRGRHKDKYKRLFETELISLPFSDDHQDTAAELLADGRLMAVTTAVLGSDYSERGPMCFGYGTGMQHGWHQDSGATDAGQFVLNRIIYPTAVHEGQGALFFVPGSTDRHGGRVSPSLNATRTAVFVNVRLAHRLCIHLVSVHVVDGCRRRRQPRDNQWGSQAPSNRGHAGTDAFAVLSPRRHKPHQRSTRHVEHTRVSM